MAEETNWRGVLNETTLLPISMVVSIGLFAFWLSAVSSMTTTNTKTITELTETSQHNLEYLRDQRQRGDTILSDRMRETDKVLRDMTDRLGRIEGKIDMLRDERKR